MAKEPTRQDAGVLAGLLDECRKVLAATDFTKNENQQREIADLLRRILDAQGKGQRSDDQQGSLA